MIDTETKHTIRRMELLLKAYGMNDWSEQISNILLFYENDEDGFKRKIKELYGGMCSFNDIILSRNGKIIFEDDKEFDELRNQLYQRVIVT